MSLHLQCRTQDEIAKAVGLSQDRIAQVLREIADLQSDKTTRSEGCGDSRPMAPVAEEGV